MHNFVLKKLLMVRSRVPKGVAFCAYRMCYVLLLWFMLVELLFLMTFRTVKSVRINTGIDSSLFWIEYSENLSSLKRVYFKKKGEEVSRNLCLILLVNCSYTGIDMPSADSCEACRVPGLEHVLATGTYQVGKRKKNRFRFAFRVYCYGSRSNRSLDSYAEQGRLKWPQTSLKG